MSLIQLWKPTIPVLALALAWGCEAADSSPADDDGSDADTDSDSDTDSDNDSDTDTDSECTSGYQYCVGEDVYECDEDGEPQFVETCEPPTHCVDGTCAGPCDDLGNSYIGCEYYPTVTQQHNGYNVPPDDVYAVAVANTWEDAAEITITRGETEVESFTVPPGGVEVVILPWVGELTLGYGPSVLVADGAYRLESTRPVTVYQYNPLDATMSNDASLLLPVNVWGQRAVVVSYPHLPSWNFPAFYAVTALQDGTSVTLTPSAAAGPMQAGGGVDADGYGEVLLNEGDVLQVISALGGDPTGTIVEADAPIQLISGHACTFVPSGIHCCCDHLEESVYPVETLSTSYMVVPPIQVPDDTQLKAQFVRVIATEDDTDLTFEPDQGSATYLSNAGDFVELQTTTAAFRDTGDKKILVAQYIVGQDAGYGTSDPAMLLAVPIDQYREDYLFHAAVSWVANYSDIIAPDGASVAVDDVPVTDWTPIGSTGYSVAHVNLSNAGTGNHTVTADDGVSVSVYGVQTYGSYWYPGGLDLETILE
jgi:hypothetical protein